MVTTARCVMCDRPVRAPGQIVCCEACRVAYETAVRLASGWRPDDEERQR